MKTYSYLDSPMKVWGIIDFDKTHKLQRIPDELIASMEILPREYGLRCPGARSGFRTNACEIKIKMTFSKLTPDIGISIYGCQSFYVFQGSKSGGRYLGHGFPASYDQLSFEKTFTKSPDMEDILIWLPRNEPVIDIQISVNDEAAVQPPTPYRYDKPVLYYGSSITECGCSTVLFNGYNCLLSRWLDVDFYNLGFSGSARGERAVAEYIAGVDMSVFVFDYDHNSPTPETLRATHEPFFKIIREKRPELPVIMMTRPCIEIDDDVKARRDIVYQTYLNAKKEGDDNVWFIDGSTFYGDTDRDLCSVDTIHPNDLGFWRMANVIKPVLKEALEKSKSQNYEGYVS